MNYSRYIPEVLLILLGAILAASSPHQAEPEPGKSSWRYLLANHKWFAEGTENYDPDDKVIRKLSTELEGIELIAFGGTWCPDTRALFPVFHKVISEVGVNINSVPVYLLDHKKEYPGDLDEKYNIRSVPTFIILKDGREVGRIVESVNGSFEKTLLKVLEES